MLSFTILLATHFAREHTAMSRQDLFKARHPQGSPPWSTAYSGPHLAPSSSTSKPDTYITGYTGTKKDGTTTTARNSASTARPISSRRASAFDDRAPPSTSLHRRPDRTSKTGTTLAPREDDAGSMQTGISAHSATPGHGAQFGELSERNVQTVERATGKPPGVNDTWLAQSVKSAKPSDGRYQVVAWK